MTSYFAVKHMLYPAGADEDVSIFSGNESSISKVSPRKQNHEDGMSPARSFFKNQRLSVNSTPATVEKE